MYSNYHTFTFLVPNLTMYFERKRSEVTVFKTNRQWNIKISIGNCVNALHNQNHQETEKKIYQRMIRFCRDISLELDVQIEVQNEGENNTLEQRIPFV